MKVLISILGLLNGAYRLIDGIHVIFKGKYIGPEKPGSWAYLFEKLGLDVSKLGPVFVIYGLVWLFWLFSLLTNQPWTFKLGLAVSVLTFWYLPVGTLSSMLILIILLVGKQKMGLDL